MRKLHRAAHRGHRAEFTELARADLIWDVDRALRYQLSLRAASPRHAGLNHQLPSAA
jgi:hypothetical protein